MSQHLTLQEGFYHVPLRLGIGVERTFRDADQPAKADARDVTAAKQVVGCGAADADILAEFFSGLRNSGRRTRLLVPIRYP